MTLCKCPFSKMFFSCARVPLCPPPHSSASHLPRRQQHGDLRDKELCGCSDSCRWLEPMPQRAEGRNLLPQPLSPQGFAPHHTDASPSSSTSQLRGLCVSVRGEQQAQELGIARMSQAGFPLPAAAFHWVFACLCPWPR